MCPKRGSCWYDIMDVMVFYIPEDIVRTPYLQLNILTFVIYFYGGWTDWRWCGDLNFILLLPSSSADYKEAKKYSL